MPSSNRPFPDIVTISAARLFESSPMTTLRLFASVAALFTLSTAAFAHDHAGHGAHVHGVGKLDVALDGATLSLHLDSPLVNLAGFEHAANSAKDKATVQSLAATLRDAGKVFAITPEAQCRVTSVQLASAALTPELLGEKSAAKSAEAGHTDHDGHADLDGDFVFTCTKPEALKAIDVNLFQAFKGFQKIDVQLVTPKKQAGTQLTPGNARIAIQ